MVCSCLLKVLTLKTMKESTFQMEKERKLLPTRLVCPTPLALLPTPRISSHPPSPPPPPSPRRRGSGHQTHSPPLLTPPSTPRSFSHLPQLLLQPRLLLSHSLSWSAACRQSGGCRTRALTPVSSVSPGQRTAASSTDELDTSCPATCAPGS